MKWMACGIIPYHQPQILWMPWDTYDSVSILCSDSAESGMPCPPRSLIWIRKQDLDLWEAQEDVEALWVFPDGTEMVAEQWISGLREPVGTEMRSDLVCGK